MELHSLRWEGAARLQEAVEMIRASVAQRHVELMQLLLRHNVMSDREVPTVPPPAIEFVIHDARDDKSTPLRRY